MIKLKRCDDPTPIEVILECPQMEQDGRITLAYNYGRPMRMVVKSPNTDTQDRAVLEVTLEQVIELRDGLTALILYSESAEAQKLNE